MNDTTLIPVRMLNEYVYCPRLFALEWLNGEWADSEDTVRGRLVHRKVDQPTQLRLPPPEERAPLGEYEPLLPSMGRPTVVRSVDLGDEELGLIAKIDLVEAEAGLVVPVDYKKGSPPAIPEGAWEPERVQVCAQGLLLRAHGYEVPRGVLWFEGAKRRVDVPMSYALIATTLRYRDEARALAASNTLPPPLVNSPKCPGCSLVGICLPDESNLLSGRGTEVRPMVPARDDGLPLYVQSWGATLGLDHEEIVVRTESEPTRRVRLIDTSRVVILGNATLSAQLLKELAARDVPVSYHSFGGWLYGSFTPASGKNVMARIAQHGAARDPAQSLRLARCFVAGKIRNSRVLLRRNGEGVEAARLERLRELAEEAEEAPDLQVLMGLEGLAARLYFERFSAMLKGTWRERFDWQGRNRRPPKDPVNALLSFAYACLSRELTNITGGIGLDPYVGFLHQPRFGRPSLALDLMEEVRPIIADSVVINALNNEVVQPKDFLERHTGVALTKEGRAAFLGVLERRMDEEATHPVLNIRLSYRRILEVQARLLCKVLTGELERYPGLRVR